MGPRGLGHESLYSFIEDACAPYEVLNGYAFIDAMHAFLE
jgi:hypothetical protein